MGDPAEDKFLQELPLGQADKFGLRRPNVKLGLFSAFVLHTPDFLTSTGWLVEVMGVGKDQILKLKVSKLDALCEWEEKQRVALYVWDSYKKRSLTAPLEDVVAVAFVVRDRDGCSSFENDGNVYFPIPVDELAERENVQVKDASTS